MVDRIERVTLRAEFSGYVRAVDEAKRKTSAFFDESSEKAEKQRAAMEKVGSTFLIAGGAIAAGLVVAVAKFADFDARMTQVQSLSHATSEDMDLLRESALRMGQGIGLSANEVADAQIELVKAGVSVKDMLGGSLVGALNLAAAGQINVGEATQIAAVAMTQFKLAGKDVPHLADLLAAGADKALGGVEELGQALNQSGLVASQFGLSIEDTIGTLSAFANAGLLGSDAGTSFKTMLLALAKPSTQAAAAMKQYNIQAYDAQGNFVGITALAGQLQKGLGGVSQAQRDAALSTIFGTDAIRSANVLYKEGSKGISQWISDVDDSGFAAEQAAGKMDNLQGDLKKLSSAVDTDLIRAGSGANDVLRDLVQGLTGLVSAIGDVPQPVLTAGLVIGGVTAAALLLGGTALVTVPKIAAFKVALVELGVTSTAVRGKMAGLANFLGSKGAWGIAITGALIAFAALNDVINQGVPSTNALENSLRKTATAADQLKAASKRGDTETTLFGDYYTSLEKLGPFLDKVTNDAAQDWLNLNINQRGALDSLHRLGESYGTLAGTDLPRAQAGFRGIVDQYKLTKDQQEKLLGAMPAYKDALTKQATELGVTASKSNLLKLAMGEGEFAAKDNTVALNQLEGAAVNAGDEIDDLADAIRGFGSAALDTRSATRDFEAAIDDATQALADNGSTLDVSTEKGRANEAALDQLAKSALDLAAAKLQETGSQEQATAAIQQGRDALIAQLAKYGITGQAAQDYANKLGLIPGNIPTAVGLTGADEAIAKAKELQALLNGLANSKVHIATGLGGSGGITKADGGIVRYYGDGGFENHVAQIAPAGSWRVWAEPETGGEAYIPLAAGKRERSMSVLRETARIMGQSLVPFAQGGWMRSQPRFVLPAGVTDGGGGGSSTTTVTVPVYAAPGQDETVLGEVIGRALARRIRK